MTEDASSREVLIVTGMSGAGRSTVGNALEDLGWYVVDNLPPQMLRPLVELASRAGDTLPESPRSSTSAADDCSPTSGDRRVAARRAPRCACSSWRPRTPNWCAASSRCAARTRCRATAPSSTASPPSGRGCCEIRETSDIIIDTSDLNIHQLATNIQESFADGGHAGRAGDRR